MLQLETVDVEVDGRIGRVILNRPDVLNCANVAWVRDLNAALESVARDPDVRVVTVTGRGRAFSTGIDLTALANGEIKAEWFAGWEKAMSWCEEMPKPVICGIHGYCLGGGLQLALACDIRVSSTDAVMGLTAVKECLIPALGVWRLPRYIGLGRAKRLIFTGENIGAAEAHQIGLVDFLVEPDHLQPALDELCEKFKRVAPTSFRHCKRLTNHAFDYDHETMLADFLRSEVECIESPENAEAAAAWRERREPDFTRFS
jgi:enoyl-CoA hydratase/carnithine racemase